METLMEPKTKKIIQKKVAKRERMARLARLRHRMEKNAIFAKVQDKEVPFKYKPQNAVYEGLFGMMVSDTDGGVDSELCYLNGSYISNAVIVQNDKNRILSVKLHKSDQPQGKELNDEVLDEWERRDDPYWANYVDNFKYTRKCFKSFLEKYKDKFEATKLDKESVKIQKAYAAKRDEMMAKSACIEITVRISDKGSTASEIKINDSFTNLLNYEFEEFIQKVLVEGLPRLEPAHKKNLKAAPAYRFDVERFFENHVHFCLPNKYLVAKNFNLKRVDCNHLIGGYFVKNAAEMSFVMAISDAETLLEGETMNRPIYRLYIEQQMVHEAQKKYFIEMYYKDHIENLMEKPKEICQFRACINKVEEGIEEETDHASTNFSDLVVKDNGETSNLSVKEEETIRDIAAPYLEYFSQFIPHTQQMMGMLFQHNNVNPFLPLPQ